MKVLMPRRAALLHAPGRKSRPRAARWPGCSPTSTAATRHPLPRGRRAGPAAAQHAPVRQRPGRARGSATRCGRRISSRWCWRSAAAEARGQRPTESTPHPCVSGSCSGNARHHASTSGTTRKADIERRLRAALRRMRPSQPQAAGWVEPRGEARRAAGSVGGQLILQLHREQTGALGRDQAAPRSAARHRSRPTPAAAQQAKSASSRADRSRAAAALPFQTFEHAGVDRPGARLALIERHRRQETDAVVTRTIDLFGGLRLAPLQTALAPTATAMSLWLSEKRAARLQHRPRVQAQAADSRKAAVRYARHTLDCPPRSASTSARANCPRSWR